MSSSGINVEENLNRLDEFHIFAYLHVKPARVLTLHDTLVDVFTSDEADPSIEIRRQMLKPYLRRVRFYYASLIKRFEYDNSLISTLVERFHPETHTFHLPWSECTITLEDVAMQLGLPIDVPDGHVGTTKYNIKLKWLKSRLQQLPLDSPKGAVVHYLPLLANYDAIITYSWGSVVLCWLYRAMCLATDYNIEGMSGCHTLLMSWIYFRLPFWAPDVTSPYTFPLATRWVGKRGKNDNTEQRLQRHRLKLDTLKFMWMLYRDARILSRVPAEFLGAPHGDFYTAVVPLILFRWIEIVNIDRVMRKFGGKQGPPNPPLNIDTFHRQSSRNDDGWWPICLQTWFEVVLCEEKEGFVISGCVLRPLRSWDQHECPPAVTHFPGDVYCPQPFVVDDPFQSSTMHQYMPYHSTYEEGGSSQGAALPHTPTDLGLALQCSNSKRSSLILWGADEPTVEAQAGRPCRDSRALSCGTGGRLRHGGHQH
ncbi:uncharacterized protein DS421_1g06340 [Arachis hypogaea]|nr:uncharacterized protein DS421_1g06340 [Arachis hypogaea]